MEHSSPIVGEDEESEEHSKRGSGDYEEVDGEQVLDVVVQECSPGGRGGLAVPDHVLGTRGSGHLDSELGELIADAWGRPRSGLPWTSCGSGIAPRGPPSDARQAPLGSCASSSA